MCLHLKEPVSSSVKFAVGRESPWQQSQAEQERHWREDAQQHLCPWRAVSSAGGRGSSTQAVAPAMNCMSVRSEPH